jgi:tetratricopeptide (TPR) repeat protein
MSADPLTVAARYVEIGRPELALQTLAGLDGDTAAHPYALLLRGRALCEMERFDDAAQAARDGLADAPADIALLYLLSVAEEGRGDLAAAEAAVLAALAEEPDDAVLLCQYARVLMHGGALDKAERVLDKPDAAEPGSTGVLTNRVSLAYLRHDDKAAERLTKELLALDPEDAQAHRLLGALAANRGDMATAAERLGTAVREDPADHRTADAARAAGDMRSLFWLPSRFFARYGAIQTWIGAVVVLSLLRTTGMTGLAVAATVAWVVFCIWSWVAAAVASRRGW